jgi:hypothetical protein
MYLVIAYFIDTVSSLELEDWGIDGWMESAWILGRLAAVCGGSSWLRMGAGGGLLWTRRWTFGFWPHGSSKLASQSVFYTWERRVIGKLINNKLERMWKETVMATLIYYHSIFVEGLRQTTENLS